MSLQEQIVRAIDAASERIIAVSREIHHHPELRFQEHFAAKVLTGATPAAAGPPGVGYYELPPGTSMVGGGIVAGPNAPKGF